jgi:hypothetical protein
MMTLTDSATLLKTLGYSVMSDLSGADLSRTGPVRNILLGTDLKTPVLRASYHEPPWQRQLHPCKRTWLFAQK